MLELLLQFLNGGLQLLHLVSEAGLWYGRGRCWLHLGYLCTYEGKLPHLLEAEVRLSQQLLSQMEHI